MNKSDFSLKSTATRLCYGCAMLAFFIFSQYTHAGIYFSEPKRIGSSPTTALTVADMDNDNHKDVVIGTIGYMVSSTIIWLKNDGQSDASFQRGGEVDIHISPTKIVSLIAIDMDNDNDIDVVSGCDTGNHVVWYENVDGSGTLFTKRIISNTLPNTRAVITCDLNGDGFQDIVAASYETDNRNNSINSRITWFQNNGASPPVFTAHMLTTAALGVISIAAADINGDAKVDVIANSPGDGRIYYFRNNGGMTPTFFPLIVSGIGGTIRTRMHAADLDGDGDKDILFGRTPDTREWWYENRGNGFPPFIQHAFPLEFPKFRDIAAADFNKDGRNDLASGWTGGIANWIENIGGTLPGFESFRNPTSGLSGEVRISIGDMNGDHDSDIVVGFWSASIGSPVGDLVYFENQFQETNAVPASNWALYE